MTGPGLAALPEGGRIDFASLRAERLERLVVAMTDADLDVLILGRPADIAFASGSRQLWTSGSRPFSPACVVLRAPRRVHLLATWDEGVPAEIPHEQLYGLSWNPAIAAGHVAGIPGLGDADRIGAAGASVGLRRLLASVAPDATVVDARAAVHAARATKSAAERAAITTACSLSEAGMATMLDHLRPGATTRGLLAVLAEELARLGAPVVPDISVAFATAEGFRTVPDDRPLDDSELVALSPSAIHAAYEGTVARTFAVGGTPSPHQSALGKRCRTALDAVLARCTTGASGAELLGAWTDAGGDPFPAPLAHGLGLGPEPPVIGLGAGTDAVLGDGTVLAVQGWMHEPGVGGWLERDVVAVGADGPELLTRWRHP